MTAAELCQWFAERERAAAQVHLDKYDKPEKPIVKPKPVDAARRRVIGYN